MKVSSLEPWNMAWGQTKQGGNYDKIELRVDKLKYNNKNKKNERGRTKGISTLVFTFYLFRDKEAETDSGNSDAPRKMMYSNASKQFLIFAPPMILTLHLKRFQQTLMGCR